MKIQSIIVRIKKQAVLKVVWILDLCKNQDLNCLKNINKQC